MAGLTLGNLLAARSRSLWLRPLRLYALLEIIVGLCGCTIAFALPLLGGWIRPLVQMLWDHQAVLNGLRFGLSFLVLLVPTTAMGLTLPVLIADPALDRQNFGRDIGLLYGANTLGAVAGAISGEAYLIAALGVFGTGVIAAVANFTSAAVAWVLARQPVIDAAVVQHVPRNLRLHNRDRPSSRLLLGSFATGAILLCLEVIWFRFLRLYVTSSATAFCVMLAVVLAGIGLGAIVAGAMKRRIVRTIDAVAISLLLAAAAVLLCYVCFPSPSTTTGVSAAYIESWQRIALRSVALMFPVAFLSGIVFSWIAAAVQEQVGDALNSAGITTLFNTIGAALGPLLASFILLPNVGFQRALVGCAGAYGVLAFVLWDRDSWSLARPAGVARIALIATLGIIFAFFPYHRDDAHFAAARRAFEIDGSYLTKKIEGTSDTFQVLRRDLNTWPYYARLVTNGFSMSSTHPRSQRYMRLFAYLPLALRPQSESALLICYGVGVTADALLRNEHLKHLDVVDISKEVFDLAASYSGAAASNPLTDARVTTLMQDGRFFLQATPRRYDIITGEPPPLKVSGTVNLYTQQFFSLMRDRLNDGGIATFWLPIYQLRVDETKAILRAFHNAFPNSSVWASSDQEWIMMGVNAPVQETPPADAQALWRQRAIAENLRQIGIEDPAQIPALFVMDGTEIERISRDVQPLSDFFPKRLTDAAPDPEATHQFAWRYLEATSALTTFRSSDLAQRMFPNALLSQLELFFVVREMRYLSQVAGSNWLAELDFYLRHSALRSPVLEVLNTDELRVSIAEAQAHALETPPQELVPDLVAGSLAARDFTGAVRLLEIEKSSVTGQTSEHFFLLTYLYCLVGRVSDADALALDHAPAIRKDWFVDWLWSQLQADFGFHPPI